MKILMVLTSHDQLGATGTKTGLWLEEFAAPYYTFKDAGANIVLRFAQGWRAACGPQKRRAPQPSRSPRYASNLMVKPRSMFATTERLEDVSEANFDAVFYSGGHGPMWDLAEDRNSKALIESFLAARKNVALVCHGPAALRHVQTPDGASLVSGKKVTGFATQRRPLWSSPMWCLLLGRRTQEVGGLYSKGRT